MTLGERLKTARSKRGISQGKLAERAGFSSGYISLVEREDREHHVKNPGIEGLKRIAAVLEVPEEWLILGVGPEPEWAVEPAPTEGAAE